MSEDLDFLSSIQLIALRNVFQADDFDYIVRKISRFYSKTFNTPLSEVENIPVAELFLNYYRF
jgi:hypothetical protein